MVIAVMGVSGCGKSTLAQALARELGWAFQEGDDLHPAAHIAKMRAGIPLDDADRGPWLDAIAAWITAIEQRGERGVVSCSALKRRYRDRLRRACPGLRWVYLELPRAELALRMARRHHFMPPVLLDDQLRTLEPPGPDEGALTVPGDQPCDVLVATVRRWLGQSTR